MAYQYIELPPEVVGEPWPVGKFLQIPLVYESIVRTRVIDNRNVKIQLWKGFCPPYASGIVGGVGAEVGIYFQSPNNNNLWMPDKDHKKIIWFRLWYGPTGNGTKFFTAGVKNCWWRHKWMSMTSWAQYKASHWNAPLISSDFKLHFIIKGTNTTIDEWW